MKLDQWLDSEIGRARSMALHFDISESGVNQWKTNGVPKGRIKAVSRFTGGAVAVEEMLPDDPGESKANAKAGKRTVKRLRAQVHATTPPTETTGGQEG